MYKLNFPRIVLLIALGALLSTIPLSWMLLLFTSFKESIAVAVVGDPLALAAMLIVMFSAVMGIIGLLYGYLEAMARCFKFVNGTAENLFSHNGSRVKMTHKLVLLPAFLLALPAYILAVVAILFMGIVAGIIAIGDQLKRFPSIGNFFKKMTEPALSKNKSDTTKPIKF